jgi:antitoxin (DNA-binding transcriptional repressor) of toxin-antitoxin stability system
MVGCIQWKADIDVCVPRIEIGCHAPRAVGSRRLATGVARAYTHPSWHPTITPRELRNGNGAITRALDGETLVVTLDGMPAAELPPIERRRFVPTATLMKTAVGLARLEGSRFFGDLDRRLDQVLPPWRMPRSFAGSPLS